MDKGVKIGIIVIIALLVCLIAFLVLQDAGVIARIRYTHAQNKAALERYQMLSEDYSKEASKKASDYLKNKYIKGSEDSLTMRETYKNDSKYYVYFTLETKNADGTFTKQLGHVIVKALKKDSFYVEDVKFSN